MLSQSDTNLNRAEAAEVAQMLRGCGVFGSVMFNEKPLFEAAFIHVEPGYENCLSTFSGGCWRSPARPADLEMMT